MTDSASVLDLPDPFEDDAIYALIEAIVADPAGQGARDAIHAVFDPWVIAARQYASGAGTSAYEMVAAAEIANVETTETLMQMLAATVLSNLIDEEGGGRANIWYSPESMTEMMQRYDMTATRDGMITLVSIKPKPGAMSDGKKLLQDTPSLRLDLIESVAFAKPQAEAKPHDRPVWAIRFDGNLFRMHDRADAERNLDSYGNTATVENRFCVHTDCPSTKCNHVPDQDSTEEVTSEG